MAHAQIKVKHPHITTNKGICGGSFIINGTRTTVRSIVHYHHDGLTPEEINIKLSYLSLSQIFDALSFYYDNKVTIDEEIKENIDEEYWESQVIKE